jgi:hypothetical protein
MIDDGDDDAIEAPPDPCPRCGRTHVAIFFGERHRTFEKLVRQNENGPSWSFFHGPKIVRTHL